MKKDIMMQLFECNGFSYIFTEHEFWVRLFRLLSLEENFEYIEILSDLEVSFLMNRF